MTINVEHTSLPNLAHAPEEQLMRDVDDVSIRIDAAPAAERRSRGGDGRWRLLQQVRRRHG